MHLFKVSWEAYSFYQNCGNKCKISDALVFSTIVLAKKLEVPKMRKFLHRNMSPPRVSFMVLLFQLIGGGKCP